MSEPLTATKQKTWHCAACGSRDIRRDAIVQWDAAREDWVVLAVLDDAWCEDCMGVNAMAAGDPRFGVLDEEAEVSNGT